MDENKILIIEDDCDIAELIESSLISDLNHPLSTNIADSAEEAFRLLNEKYFDLIITDYKLPGLSGLNVIENLKEDPNYQSTPIIFISGFFNELKTVPEGKEFENVVFMNKPFEIDRLVKNVKFFLLCKAKAA